MPDSAVFIDTLGWALFKVGRYEEAAEQFEKAVSIDPALPDAHDHLGDTYAKLNRIADARAQWQIALQNRPPPELETKLKDKLSE